MSSPIGAQCHLGIVKEASFGAGGPVSTWQTFTSEGLNATEAFIFADRIQSTAEQVGSNVGLHAAEGDITFPVTPKMSDVWFECGVGNSSGVYYSERPLDSMMVQIDHETSAIQASGCMIESLAFSSSQGGELSCVASLQAKGMSKVAAGSPTYTSGDNPYVHQEAVFTLNGVVDNSVTAWNLTIANNLVGDLYGTGRQRIDIPAGKMAITGSFTKLFDDTSERDAFLDAKERQFKVAFSRGGQSLVFWAPKIRYNTHTENIGGQSDYILETFGWVGYSEDPSTQQSLRVSGDFT